MPGLNPLAEAFGLGSSTPGPSTAAPQSTLNPYAATFISGSSPQTAVSNSIPMVNNNPAQSAYYDIEYRDYYFSFYTAEATNLGYTTDYAPINYDPINHLTASAEGVSMAAPSTVKAAHLLQRICLSQVELALVFENDGGLNFEYGSFLICAKIVAAFWAKVQEGREVSTYLGCKGIGGAVAKWLKSQQMPMLPPVDFSQSTQMGETVAMLLRSNPKFSFPNMPPEEQKLPADVTEDGAPQSTKIWTSAQAEAEEQVDEVDETDWSQFASFTPPTTTFSEAETEPRSLKELVMTSDPL